MALVVAFLAGLFMGGIVGVFATALCFVAASEGES